MNRLNDRAIEMHDLSLQISGCTRCPGLNIRGKTQSAPGYGTINSPVLILGQSLCEPCMETQIPFTKGSGRFLDRAFELSGITKKEVFITNVIHCHPPKNRPSLPNEILNCKSYLVREIELVEPELIIGLGKDAKNSLHELFGVNFVAWDKNLRKPKGQAPVILLMHHPSFILRQKREARHSYVELLAMALRWSFNQPFNLQEPRRLL